MTLMNVLANPDAVEIVVNDECAAAGQYFSCPKYVVFSKINAVIALSGATKPLLNISFGVEHGIEHDGDDVDVIAAALPDWLVGLYAALAETEENRPASMNAMLVLAGYSLKRGRMAAWVFSLSAGKCDVMELDGQAVLMPGELPAVKGYVPKSMADLRHAARLQNRHAKAALGEHFPAAGSLDCITVRPGAVAVERLPLVEWADVPRRPIPGKWGFLAAAGVPVRLAG